MGRPPSSRRIITQIGLLRMERPRPPRSTADPVSNAPALAWAWLTQRLSGPDDGTRPSVEHEWNRFRSEMDGRRVPLASITTWLSDYWIAKSQYEARGHLAGRWSLPDRIDQWPCLEMQNPFKHGDPRVRPTNSAALLDLLTATHPAHVRSGADACRRFAELRSSSTAHADAAMISFSQTLGWLTAALGDLLKPIALTPTEDAESRDLVVRAAAQRFFEPDTLPVEYQLLGSHDDGCEWLYNARMTQQGVQILGTRQGQGTEWQHHWLWMSTPQDAEAMTATLQLTGLLLINEPLLAGLTTAVHSGDNGAKKRALCVARRWMMTTKALAWLVEALRHTWSTVRPQDLACFAFGALSPAWPRRTVAVSHRSDEAKPMLSTLAMWRSPHAAIDATYVPAWETNTGMIWSLFAPVPLLARVNSQAYFESEWCQREYELLQYLVEHADFVEGRMVIDIRVDDLPELDAALVERESVSSDRPTHQPAPRVAFPPFSFVLVGDLPDGLEMALLRAAGALRMINARIRDAPLANELARRAAAGRPIDLPAPTNNPDGWSGYGRTFRELQALLPAPEHRRLFGTRRSFPLRVPDDYPEHAVLRDAAAMLQIPDLSSGQYQLADVLVALEWQTSVLDWFANEEHGDKVIIDVSDLSPDEWAAGSQPSLARGLLALQRPTPTWIIQRAGQNAHEWSGFRDQPIFTWHIEHQFPWLKPVGVNALWLIYYLANSGMEIGSHLKAAMIETVARSLGAQALQTERHPDGLRLLVPRPNEFFVIPSEVEQEVLDMIGGAADTATP